ncbi:AraC family transcriptional regulator [Mesorhizobium sp. L-8-10]|uniref:GlxA family transcriptional regulator n=1 Tax=Mesorhizobium sp. L-8-10 TaxID=2744523 RepID=UPI0019382150|nr:helix-turn-helix domain-containing protein [Mesorhizobium sp. L-8-10]BCH34430.1 AraC family transcriptional regulator [Mesorhizobium sp. L-8-10]
MTPTNNPPVRVSLLALAESSPAVLYGLFEVFQAVGSMWRELTGEDTGSRRWEARIVGRDGTPFASAIGPPITPDTSLVDSSSCDIVIVTDLALAADLEPGDWGAEIAWLRRRHEEGALLCSVCTGSVLLAESGLLDGLEATTHWSATAMFRERYSSVRLRPERILCPAGAGHSIVTSGGPGSWEDLALSLIARFSGQAEAVRIAKIFLLGDRSDGQLVFSAMGRPRSHGDAVIGDCQAWLADNYARPHPVSRMTQRSGLAERTFKRRFKAATGYAPVDYVQALRIEEAKQILETTGEPTDGVAHMVGYDDPAFFRRLFKRRTGVTPARYRQRFRMAF